MISTVTTSTISTITTAALAGSVALIAILVLLMLLIQKELAVTGATSRLQKVNRALNVGLVPLLVVFFALVAVKMIEVLQ